MAAGIIFRKLNYQMPDVSPISSMKEPSQSVKKLEVTFEEFKEKLLKHIEDSQTIIHKKTLSKMVRRMEESDSSIVHVEATVSCPPQIFADLLNLKKFTETDKPVRSFRIRDIYSSDTLIKMTVEECF